MAVWEPLDALVSLVAVNINKHKYNDLKSNNRLIVCAQHGWGTVDCNHIRLLRYLIDYIVIIMVIVIRFLKSCNRNFHRNQEKL